LGRIAVTQVNRRRRRSWWLQLFRDSHDEDVTLEAMVSADASAEVKSQLFEIDAQVQKLPEDLRTAWTLRFVLGLSLDEVAATCSCSLATVKRRLQKAQEVVTMEVEVPS
jgi:RNA polymerase sigma-70 factor (ECF subfamily)